MEALDAFVQRCPDAQDWWVAYSGGLDSTVLLHAAMVTARKTGASVRAVHVNHGLQAAAEAFEQHCVSVCAQWDVPLECRRCTLNREAGQSRQAQARDARYRILREYAQPRAAVLLAHHQDDQAETVLLQLLRGAGPDGAAGMAEVCAFGEASLARPLLGLSRCEIEAYAASHQLPFIEDPSNQEVQYDRNFLRREIVPRLHERWPQASATLSRAASHAAHASRLLSERAQEDLERSDGMSVAYLESLSEDRALNLLRYWIGWQGHPRPSERRLRHWLRIISSAAPDRVPVESFVDYELHRWRGRLYLSAKAPQISAGQVWHWRRGKELELPELGMRLSWDELTAQMSQVPDSDVDVRLRAGGECCRLVGHRHRRPLKKLLQEAGVPPWQRNRIPLIYQDAQLRLVWKHFECLPQAQDS